MASSPEVEIISSLTQPGASVESATKRLLALTAAASAAGSNENGDNALSTHIYNVWFALVEDVVANTPAEQQGVLVDFVRALRMQKVVNPATGDQLLYNLVTEHFIPVWTGLPLLGVSVRDEWNFDAQSCTPAEAARYYNKLSFLARLTGQPENNLTDPDSELPPYDFSLYALWDFRDVFEENLGPGPARTILLRGVSLWMIYCANKLWANVQLERSFMHTASGTNPAQAGERVRNRNKWTGFNRERWSLWIEELNHVNEEDDDVLEIVRKALNEAERVQRSA